VVTDNAWTPNMFTDSAPTQLADFGTHGGATITH
jgi:hypothetical protein